MNTRHHDQPERETRHLRGLELREAPKDSGLLGVLAGYAAVFNSDSVEFKGWEKPWVERIAPGAFKRSLAAQPEVFALWQHDPSQVIARSPDTLKIEEDDKGLRVEIGLPDTTTARDLLARVRAKIVDAMSFGFTVREQSWKETEQRDERTLLDVDLFEVSAVVWPAYPETTLAVRSHEAWRKSLNSSASSPSASVSPRMAGDNAGPTPGGQQTATVQNSFSERSYWESRLGLRK